ncbi:hypothetical protein [Paenibacillus sabuli]|nr:hypothetical protein [Paenibacillus sabuli]
MKKGKIQGIAGFLAAWLLVLAAWPAGPVYGDEPEPPPSLQASYYVATDGDDDNPGTGALPFATLQRAQQEVRAANDAMTGDIVVYVRGGRYVQSDTWVLDDRDSGTGGHTVVYAAYGAEQPIIEGSRDIGGWSLYDAGANIYAAPAEALQTRQLYVNGNRAVRARMEQAPAAAVKTETGYTSDDAWLATLSEPGEVEAVFQAAWTSPRIRVDTITAQSGQAEIALQATHWQRVMNRSHLKLWYLENAYAFLDQPGEWYLDEQDETIYYKPRPGEDMGTARVTAPVLEHLVRIDGGSADTPVQGLRFEGLGFAYASWQQPTDELGWIDEQNNYKVGTLEMPEAAMTVRFAQGVTFERCEFSHLGGTGINLLQGVQDHLIQGGRFYDISGSAINAGETSKQNAEVYNPSDTRLILRNNDIVNNYIHDIGVEYKSATALTVAFPMDIDISHNEIFNVPYSGISFFGSVYAPVTTTAGAKVQHNFIHHLMNDGMFDGGAIYAFGVTGGTAEQPNLISGNYIKNQMNRYAAIYMDQSSNDWLIEDNVIDLRAAPIWDDIYDTNWAFANVRASDLEFTHNYSTTSAFWNKSGEDSIVQTNTHIHPDANWPSAAQAIIGNAGLEPAYQDLAAGTIERVDVPATLNLETAQTAMLDVGAANGRGEPISLAGAQIHYVSADPSIATVDASGLVTAVDAGHTTLDLYIYLQGRLVRQTIAVYVDDVLDDIEVYYALENVKHIVPERLVFVPGSVRQLVARGITRDGQILGSGNVSIASSDPTVASVVYGQLTTGVVGTADLTFTTSLNGVVVSRTVEIIVADYSDPTSLTVPAYSLNEAIRDPRGWYSRLPSGTITPGSGTLDIDTPGSGYAFYEDLQFGDELLSMNMKINATGGWPAIVLRNQRVDRDFTAADNSLYMICIKANIIELHRFAGGERTVFFGEIAGFDSLGAASYPNHAIPFHETRLVQAGAVTEPGGVRIILNVDGQNVFTYLDTSEDRITEDGYFGLYARSGSITLGETDIGLPGEEVWPIPDDPTAELWGSGQAVTGGTVTMTGAVVPNSALDVVSAELTYDPAVLEYAGIASLADGVSVSVTEAVYGTLELSFSGTGTALEGYDPQALFAATFEASSADPDTAVTLSGVVLTDAGDDEIQTTSVARTLAIRSPAPGGIYEHFDAYAAGSLAGVSGYTAVPADLGYYTAATSPSATDRSLRLYKTSTDDAATSTLAKVYSPSGMTGQVRVSYQLMKASGTDSPQSFVNLRDTTGKVIATIIMDSSLRVRLDEDYTLVSAGHLQEDRWYEVTLELDFDAHTASVRIEELAGEQRVWALGAQEMQSALAANISRAEYVLWRTRTASYLYNNLAIEPIAD